MSLSRRRRKRRATSRMSTSQAHQGEPIMTGLITSRRAGYRPRLELLEERTAPAVIGGVALPTTSAVLAAVTAAVTPPTAPAVAAAVTPPAPAVTAAVDPPAAPALTAADPPTAPTVSATATATPDATIFNASSPNVFTPTIITTLD